MVPRRTLGLRAVGSANAALSGGSFSATALHRSERHQVARPRGRTGTMTSCAAASVNQAFVNMASRVDFCIDLRDRHDMGITEGRRGFRLPSPQTSWVSRVRFPAAGDARVRDDRELRPAVWPQSIRCGPTATSSRRVCGRTARSSRPREQDGGTSDGLRPASTTRRLAWATAVPSPRSRARPNWSRQQRS